MLYDAAAVDFNIEVLTGGSWPFTAHDPFGLPREVTEYYYGRAIEHYSSMFIESLTFTRLRIVLFEARLLNL